MEILKLLTDQIKLKKIGDNILDEDLKKIEQLYKKDKLDTLDYVGSGCFGTVYKYTSESGKEYAIKYGDKECRCATIEKSYDIETLLLLQDDEHIIKIHAYDNTNLWDKFIIIVDYVEGMTIEDYEFEFSLKENFVAYFKETLQFLEKKNISINDLHESNIMISHDGLPIIVDFGGLFQVKDKTDMNIDGEEGYEESLQMIEKLYKNYLKSEKMKRRKKDIA